MALNLTPKPHPKTQCHNVLRHISFHPTFLVKTAFYLEQVIFSIQVPLEPTTGVCVFETARRRMSFPVLQVNEDDWGHELR